MSTILGMSKLTSKGQATIPVNVREELGLGAGDRVTFARNDDGQIVLFGDNVQVLRSLKKAFEGGAEELGVRTEDDVVALIKELRTEQGA